MSILIGTAFAAGVLLVVWAVKGGPMPVRPRRRSKMREQTARAGLNESESRLFTAVAVLVPLVVFLFILGLTRTWTVALAVALAVTPLPFAWLNARVEKHTTKLRTAWPDVVDSLLAAIRAGVALPEAVVQLAQVGPQITRPHFELFAREYRASGRFHDALDAVQADLADPTADRLFEVLRLAKEVGGSELGHLLRDLSAVMRDDVRVRGELLARQSWTVNAARLAVAAPWLVLVLISTRLDAAAAYSSPTGVAVLTTGGAACLGAYLVMRKIGRLDGVSA
ncbi:MAG: type II secretion system F family protein [Actinomycetaceae bacterium]|nr:type II secretion system F family protein [Actinomycetaceae bacterium]